MKAHEVRLIEEFKELYIRCLKLNKILKKYENNTLDFELRTPYELLLEQKDVMERYLCILFERFKYEEIFDEICWSALNEMRLEILNE